MTSGRRWLILAICCMSLFIVTLDNTIVNMALPAIRREFGSSLSELQWTIDAYTIVLASLLILSGSVADRIGRRRTFQAGLLLFSLGSLLCGLAPGTGPLIVFRALQAIGGSMLNPVALSIITNTFPEPRERANAVGVWGGVIGLSMALGPVLGGMLVDLVSWRAVFWINVPVAVLAILLVAAFVPESRAPRASRLDPLGQTAMTILLLALVSGIIEGPHFGWDSAPILGCFTVALATGVFFVRHEWRRDEPLLDPRLFASRPFSGAIVIALAAFAVLSGFLFLNILYLQSVRGFSALYAGILTLPMAVANGVFALVSGWFTGRIGARVPLVIAGAAMVAATLLLTGLTASTSTGYLVTAYLLLGIGLGMVNSPIVYTALSGMPPAQAGTAAAIAATGRQIGTALGVAVLGSILTSASTGPAQAGFLTADRISWWIMTGAGALILVLGLRTAGPRRSAPR